MKKTTGKGGMGENSVRQSQKHKKKAFTLVKESEFPIYNNHKTSMKIELNREEEQQKEKDKVILPFSYLYGKILVSLLCLSRVQLPGI